MGITTHGLNNAQKENNTHISDRRNGEREPGPAEAHHSHVVVGSEERILKFTSMFLEVTVFFFKFFSLINFL